MKRKYTIIFLVIVLLLLVLVVTHASKTKNKTAAENNVPIVSDQHQPIQDLSDHAVFADGSVPTTWDVAGITDPIAFKKFLISVQSAVLNHDKEMVIASMDKKFGSREYVRAHYDVLFNQKVEDAFKNMNIHEIFRNYQGAMIGNGTVWFEQNVDDSFSILAINNT